MSADCCRWWLPLVTVADPVRRALSLSLNAVRVRILDNVIQGPASSIRVGGGAGYNVRMSDQPIDDEVVEEKPTDEEARPKPPADGPVFAPAATGKEAWRGNPGCGGRVPLYGCGIGLLLLIGVLIAGTSMMKSTVWVNFERSRSAVINGLPRGLPQQEANRTRKNLDHFRAMLERVDDPYPMMGEFVTRVREIFTDGRIEDEELELLNLILEKWIEESGIPPIQLDARIRNSKFGMRNYRASAHTDGRQECNNSELRTPNSELI